ncbi:MAG: hypothetical protein ACOCUT_00165 [bacterium]
MAVVTLFLSAVMFVITFWINAEHNFLSILIFKLIPFTVALWLLILGLSLLSVLHTPVVLEKQTTQQVEQTKLVK